MAEPIVPLLSNKSEKLCALNSIVQLALCCPTRQAALLARKDRSFKPLQKAIRNQDDEKSSLDLTKLAKSIGLFDGKEPTDLLDPIDCLENLDKLLVHEPAAIEHVTNYELEGGRIFKSAGSLPYLHVTVPEMQEANNQKATDESELQFLLDGKLQGKAEFKSKLCPTTMAFEGVFQNSLIIWVERTKGDQVIVYDRWETPLSLRVAGKDYHLQALITYEHAMVHYRCTVLRNGDWIDIDDDEQEVVPLSRVREFEGGGTRIWTQLLYVHDGPVAQQKQQIKHKKRKQPAGGFDS